MTGRGVVVVADANKGDHRSGLPAMLGWLVALLGVPGAAAAGANWRAIAANPVPAGALVLGGAALVVVAGVGREVWRRFRPRLIDRVYQGVDRRISRFDRRYRRLLLSERFVDLRGLVMTGVATPELDQVYVDVSLAPRDPHQMPDSDLTDRWAPGERLSLDELLSAPQPHVLAVVGAPGSGKTTLLRHTARVLSKSRTGRVPILLYLRDHITAITAGADPSLPDLIRTALAPYGLVEPAGWFGRRLSTGKCVVLLDGLDEVARQEDRQAVSDWVGVQIRRYPKNDFVITSRPQGYRTAPIEGAAKLQTRRFTREQISRFVHAWYHAVERISTGGDDEDVERRARTQAGELLDRLRHAPALEHLTVNPLLLTMIAIVHRHHGALPGSRAELYGQICEVLHWRRQDAKKLLVEPRGNQKMLPLRELAYEMMRRRVRDLTKDETIVIIRKALRRVSRELDPTAFLADAGSNGLLIERESGIYAFAHLTFQEYLAAAHIQDRGLVRTLTKGVGDDWWRETTLLYVADADAGPVVAGCLEANTVPALALAFDCAEEARELSGELRERLSALRAEQITPGTDPERRRLLIGITVARHLRRVVSVADGSRLCVAPIPWGIYRFFLEDMSDRWQFRFPDCSRRVPFGMEETVAGVRGGDAIVFADWVNELMGDEPLYRLPTRAEIEDPAATQVVGHPDHPLRGVWIASGSGAEGPPDIWSQVRDATLVSVGKSTMLQHLENDFREPLVLLSLLLIRARLVTGSVVRALGSDRALDFTRVRAGARDLGDLLDFDLARVRDLALDLDLAQTLGPTGADDADLDRARDLAFARVLDFARALELTPTLACAKALERAVARVAEFDLARTRALAREHDLPGNRDLITRVRDIVHTLERARHLRLGLSANLDLVRFLDLARNLDFASSRAELARSPDPVRDAADDLMGTALLRTVDLALGRSEAISSSSFARCFAEIVGVRAVDHVASSDALEHMARAAPTALLNGLPKSDTSSWTRRVVAHFRHLVGPMLARQIVLTTEKATAVRVLSLCLAVDADARDMPEVGDTFRQIAIGVTWLERRHNGEDQPTETIVLAMIDE